MSLPNLIFLVYQVIAILAVIHVIMDNRQPAKTLAWALFIYFIPLIGLIAYLFFGVNTRKERYVSKRSLDQLTRRSMLKFAEQPDLVLPAEHKPIIDMFVKQSNALPFSGSKVDLMVSGHQFFPALLHDIAEAKSHIHIDIYIFEDDPLGQLVSDALIDRAKAGVEVRIIYDDVGCWSVKSRFFERMREAGIEVEPFMPVHFPKFTSKANYRNHRKLIVIDGHVGYIGGMNIALRYVNGGKKHRKGEPRAWRDTMARIEGQGVFTLQRTFLIDWYFVDRTLLSDKKYYTPLDPPDTTPLNPPEGGKNHAAPSPAPVCASPIPPEGRKNHAAPSPAPVCASAFPPSGGPRGVRGVSFLQTVTSGPVTPYPEIMQGYARIILSARSYIFIETPYFLPTSAILLALKTAASSGVDVRILVPLHSDAWLTEWASRSYLREVADAGAKVLYYEAGFLHSKLMVSDDSVCTCGSTNIDFRSFENNFEANTFFYGEEVAVRMRDIFLADEQQSVSLSQLASRQHPKFFTRLWESLTRLFSPLL